MYVHTPSSFLSRSLAAPCSPRAPFFCPPRQQQKETVRRDGHFSVSDMGCITHRTHISHATFHIKKAPVEILLIKCTRKMSFAEREKYRERMSGLVQKVANM